MVDIYNLSDLIAGRSRKESDIVQLNGADLYLRGHFTELAVGDWKEDKYVSQLFVCAQIIAKCFCSI